MSWGLRRFQETGQLHFLTFSCYERRPNFTNAPSRTRRPGLGSRLLSNGYDEATDFASTAMS